MSTTTLATLVTEADTNREHLSDLRSVCAVNEANPLILGVAAKVEAGETLNAIEYGILWNGVTEETVELFRRHPELL
jgi:hypothetical protein